MRNSNTPLLTRAMLRRSIIFSVVVGGLLFVINHETSDWLHPWTRLMWRQLGLSMIVPFVVSLTAAVLTRRELLDARGSAPSSRTPE